MNNQYIKIFNLTENYTLEELKKALIIKVNSIKNNNTLNVYEKNMIINKYQEYYKILKNNKLNNNQNNSNQISLTNHPFISSFFNFNNDSQDVFNRLKDFNSKNGENYYYSYSSSSMMNNNGDRTFIKSSNEDINGKKKNYIEGYKIDKDGNKIPLQFKKNLIKKN